MNIRASAGFRPGNVAGALNSIAQRNLAATTKGTEIVLFSSLEKVAVDTGALQTSGHMEVKLEGLVVTGSVIYDQPYAAYVEFGTGIRGAQSAGAGPYPYNMAWPGMAAQPYLRNSLDESHDAIVGEFRNQGFN